MMNKIFCDYFCSPLGVIEITVINNSIVSVKFVDHIGTVIPHPIIDSCKQQLNLYFSKKSTVFSLPMNPVGTPFQQKVWKTLETICFGKVTSYKELAKQMGRPTSVRAIANAISKNPILILIPCHRVIGSDGSLTGYVAGIDKKQFLLELEKEHD